jgi:hypothetical protein
MAQLPAGFDPFFLKHEAERQEEIQAGMLEDLERLTGIPFGDLLASELEPTAPEPKPEPEPEREEMEPLPAFEEQAGGFQVGAVEDTIEDAFDSRNDIGDDLGDYLDQIFDESDIPGDALDAYGEDEV